MVARILGLALAAATAAASVPAPCSAETPDSDPRAVAIADQVMETLGGRPAWDALVGLRWTFESAVRDTMRPGARRHAWNKHTGWHRVEGTNRQGQSFVVVHDMDGAEGRAWVDGVALEGDSLRNMLARARSMWTNDTYWMLMPYKLRDPGVRLMYAGEVKEGGALWDKLALSFERVGETPGDRYWVYVNRATHRVEKWEYVLQGAEPPPRMWTWGGWERHGGLWFPTAHHSGDATLYTHRVEAVTQFPPQTFSAP